MWQKFGEYQLNHFRHIQQKSSGGGGGGDFASPNPKFDIIKCWNQDFATLATHFASFEPLATLIPLKLESRILQPFVTFAIFTILIYLNVLII